MARFDGLNEAFNTEFEQNTGEETNSSPVLSHNLITLPSEESQKEDKVVLENKNYVKTEIVSLIDTCQNILMEQKDNLKEDAKASQIMAIADLVRTTTDLLKELNSMDKVENDLNIKKNAAKGLSKISDINPGSVTFTNSVTLSGKDMVNKILEFQRNSELNSIDTNFNTDGQPQDD